MNRVAWHKQLSCWLAALLLLASLPLAARSASAAALPSDFVTTSGAEFMLGGSKFYFAGTNNYYFHYKSAKMVDDVLDDMAAMNLKVLRIWGFMDGEGSDGVAMQTSPGVFEESGFKKLDYAVYRAGQLGIKLVIPFTNNWNDFGGMNQYVKWFNAASHDDFYTNASIKTAYKNYINFMLNRVNTYTGVKYKDDPAIMTWELANEPRNQSDKTGNTLLNWADEMSTYVRSLDANHLIAVGDEGFYNEPSNPSYPYQGGEGVDWKRLTALPNVSYGTMHLYPDHWNTTADWGTQWIKDHIRDGKTIGKPVVLEEFGFKDPATRNQVYTTWLGAVADNGGAGSQFWLLTGINDDGTLYADYDGFRVTYPSALATVISNHAAVMNAKSVPTAAPAQPGNVTAEAGHRSVKLSWDRVTGAQSYQVKRATVSGGPYTTVASSLAGTSYSDTGLTNGTTYYYVVNATNVVGSSPDSVPVSAKPTAAAPGAFTLTAQASDGSVSLSWTAASGAASYDVKRATSSAGPFTTVAPGLLATTYTDTTAANGTTYYYNVAAQNEIGATVSNTATAKPVGLVKVEYRAGDLSATDSTIRPHIKIVNTGTTSIQLSDYKLRYWYTKGSATQADQLNCDWVVLGCANVSATFQSVTPPVAGADRYMEVSFGAGAGTLGPGANSGDIQLTQHLSDWSSQNENDDYSYMGTQTSYALSEKITLYKNGVLVWGTEPGGIVTPTPVVPAAPTGLTATAGNAQAALSWTASTGATGYNVKRATTSGGPYTTVAAGVTSTSYANTGLTNGTTYYYVVSAANSAGESANSAQASATPQAAVTVPSAPTGLTATAGNAQAALSWTASTGATGYNVKRATTSGGPYTTIAAGVTSTSYTNTGLTNGTTYYYVVSAVNGAGESASSAQASATPAGTVTPPTGNLTVQYKVNNANATDNMIYATFNIKNTGSTAVSLSGLKLRYYLTKDSSSASLSYWTDYAQVGTANVSGAFTAITPAKTNADTYAELSFTAAAGSIAPGGQTGDIQIRIGKSDWSNFNENNDYSFDGTKSAYADWNKVTLYQSGTLVWGTEP